MLRATRIRERCSRRAVAALAAAVLILVAWLGARHEAEVAHVIDQNGVAVHAQKISDHHEESSGAHVHGRDAHDHAPGACALLATAHAAAIAPRTPAALPLAAIAEASVAPPPTVVRAAIAGYRLAPKTSPPTRA